MRTGTGCCDAAAGELAMIAPTTERAEGCPYLRPQHDWRGRVRAALYCDLPGGRVRVPDPADIARYCATGEYEACPTYRRARAREESSESLS